MKEFIVQGFESNCAQVSIETYAPVHCQYSVLRGKSLCFEALQREGKHSRDHQVVRIWLAGGWIQDLLLSAAHHASVYPLQFLWQLISVFMSSSLSW